MYPSEWQVKSHILESCSLKARPQSFVTMVFSSSPIVLESNLPSLWVIMMTSIFWRGVTTECLFRMRTMASSPGDTNPADNPSISLLQNCRSLSWKIDRLPCWSHAAKQGWWLKGIRIRRNVLPRPWGNFYLISATPLKIWSWRSYVRSVHPVSLLLHGLHIPHGPTQPVVFVVPSTTPFTIITKWGSIDLTQRYFRLPSVLNN